MMALMKNDDSDDDDDVNHRSGVGNAIDGDDGDEGEACGRPAEDCRGVTVM